MIIRFLALFLFSASLAFSAIVPRLAAGRVAGSVSSSTGGGPPTVASASIGTAGTGLNVTWTQGVSNGVGGSGGLTMSATGGAITTSYSTGSGSTSYTFFPFSRIINAGETVTISYTQPGNGFEATTGGADVASFSGLSVTNNSTQGSGTAPNFVQKAELQDTANSNTVPVNITTTAGNSMWVAVSWYGGGGASSVTGFSDGANTWTAATTVLHDVTNNQYMQIWYALNIAGGATTPTATLNNLATYRYIIIHEVTGAKTTGALDQVNNGTIGTGTNFSLGTITPSNNFQYIFMAAMNDGGAGTGTFTAGSGFTLQGSIGPGDYPMAAQYQRVNTATGITAAITFSAADAILGQAVSIKSQ